MKSLIQSFSNAEPARHFADWRSLLFIRERDSYPPPIAASKRMALASVLSAVAGLCGAGSLQAGVAVNTGSLFNFVGNNPAAPVDPGSEVASDETNIAHWSNGTTPFAISEYGFPHLIVHLNDGIYGNSYSWICASLTDSREIVLGGAYPTVNMSFAGIALPAAYPVTDFIFGRSAANEYQDRIVGTMYVQIATDTAPLAPSFCTDAASDSAWTTVGSFTTTDSAEHHFKFNSPMTITGLRIVTQAGNCIDEIVCLSNPDEVRKDILSFSFPSLGDAEIQGANITKVLPNGTDVTALSPTITVTAGASVSPASGVAQDFTNAVTYTVTASDSSTKDFVVELTILPATPPVSGYTRWFDASSISANDGDPITAWVDFSGNSIDATVPEGNAAPTYVADAGTGTGLSALYFPMNNTFDSGAFRFSRDINIRTVFSVFKGSSFLLTDTDTYNFHRAGQDDPADPIVHDFYASPNILNGSIYINGELSTTPAATPMPTDLHNGFNLVEIVTAGDVQADSFNRDRGYNAGNQYQAEVIIYDRVLSEEERLLVEHYLMDKWFGTGGVTAYATWAAANAGDQSPDLDYDNDGMPNGVEYFMGETGGAFTPNPPVLNDGTEKSVTWPYQPAVEFFQVQVSDDLDIWTEAPSGVVVVSPTPGPGSVTYTFPDGSKQFCRLVVIP